MLYDYAVPYRVLCTPPPSRPPENPAVGTKFKGVNLKGHSSIQQPGPKRPVSFAAYPFYRRTER